MCSGLIISNKGLAGDWTSPSDDTERIVYRLEWYAFQFFANLIELKVFLTVIYQSWLQLAMIRTGQDKSGPIFKEFGIFNNDYFIAFGGSADNTAKSGNQYYADRRFRGKCNNEQLPGAHQIFEDFGWHKIAKPFFVNREITINEFLAKELTLETDLYIMEGCRTDNQNAFKSFVNTVGQVWFNTIPFFVQSLSEAINHDAVREAKYGHLFYQDPVATVKAQQQNTNMNDAYVIGGIGVALLAGLAYFLPD